MECEDYMDIISERIGSSMIPLSSLGPMAYGNMENISPTIPINISHDPARLRMSILGQNVPMLRFKNIPSCLKNFMISLLGLMIKC